MDERERTALGLLAPFAKLNPLSQVLLAASYKSGGALGGPGGPGGLGALDDEDESPASKALRAKNWSLL